METSYCQNTLANRSVWLRVRETGEDYLARSIKVKSIRSQPRPQAHTPARVEESNNEDAGSKPVFHLVVTRPGIKADPWANEALEKRDRDIT